MTQKKKSSCEWLGGSATSMVRLPSFPHSVRLLPCFPSFVDLAVSFSGTSSRSSSDRGPFGCGCGLFSEGLNRAFVQGNFNAARARVLSESCCYFCTLHCERSREPQTTPRTTGALVVMVLEFDPLSCIVLFISSAVVPAFLTVHVQLHVIVMTDRLITHAQSGPNLSLRQKTPLPHH